MRIAPVVAAISLARLPEALRNEVFTEHMSKTPEPPCKVVRSFLQGFTGAPAACLERRVREDEVLHDHGGRRPRGEHEFVDCERLEAATQRKRACVKKS